MKRLVNGKLSCALTVAAFSGMALAKTIYLDASATAPSAPYGSWETAASDAKTAFAAADGSDTILVAPGTYFVSEELQINGYGVTVRSANRETGLLDPEHTIFDGSTLTSGSIVRPQQGNPTFDGLTFRNGRSGSDNGGALFLKDWLGAPKVLNCRFENNAANACGGALYIHVGNDSAVVSNCVFAGNVVTATSYNGGGGVYTWSPVKFYDCVFSNNWVSGSNPRGGAIFITSTDGVQVFGGTFVTNGIAQVTEGTSRGGAIEACDKSVTVSGARFSGYMKAQYGGAIDCSWNAIITNCTFEGLFGDVSYGVIHPNGNVQVIGCRLLDSKLGGSFVFQEYSTGKTLRNCLVANGNTALQHGFSGGGTVEHCTFVGNSVQALKFSGSGKTLVLNSILEGQASVPPAESTLVVSNSYMTAASGGSEDFGNIVGCDPRLKVATNGDVRLRADSPLVDRGLVLDWTSDGLDLNGSPRTVGAGPDIGCCERQAGEEDFTRVVATEAERTDAWKNAFVDVQAAVDATGSGSSVLFKAGTYALPDAVRIVDRAISLEADEGEVVLDGQGQHRCLFVRSTVALPIVVRGITFANGTPGESAEGESCGGGVYLHAGTSAAAITLTNCTVRNCWTQNSGQPAGYGRGGGIYGKGYVSLVDSLVENCAATNAWGGGACVEASRQDEDLVTVTRCVFRGNDVYRADGSIGEEARGGGLKTSNRVIVDGCDFLGNTCAGGNGAGVYLGYYAELRNSRSVGNSGSQSVGAGYDIGVTFSNCVFTANQGGQVLFAYSGKILVTHSVFTNNFCDSYMSVGVDPTFRNCLFSEPENRAIFINQGSGNCPVENCTFVGCKTAVYVWGYGGGNSRVSLANCLFNGNAQDFFRDPNCTSNPSVFLTNCALAAYPDFSQYEASGCILTSNPRFADAVNRDWRIKTGSPCRDRGVMRDWMDSAATDLDGLPRVVTQGVPLADDPKALPDIGCYECQAVSPGFSVILW